MPGTRLRQGFDGISVLGRRSFSEGGKAGHDEYYWNTQFHRPHLSQTLRSANIGA